MSRENYTNKTSRRKRSCDFDARPRVRVYYTTLTSKIFVEKYEEFVCLQYAKTHRIGFKNETKPRELSSSQ